MSQDTLPTLHAFAISHYCEKARWALELLGVRHRVRMVAPIVHLALARRLGLKRASVPILTLPDGGVVQGSSQIIDWAEAQAAGAPGGLAQPADREAAAAIEARLGKVLGVHVRRFFYSEALIECPETVRPLFRLGLPPAERAFLGLAWWPLRRVMVRAMDLGPAQGQASREVLLGELDWLDGLLADGRDFLAGDALSRVDIAAAALAAPLVLPKEHPEYGDLVLPPGVAKDCAAWAERPFLAWTRALYARHRQPAAGAGRAGRAA